MTRLGDPRVVLVGALVVLVGVLAFASLPYFAPEAPKTSYTFMCGFGAAPSYYDIGYSGQQFVVVDCGHVSVREGQFVSISASLESDNSGYWAWIFLQGSNPEVGFSIFESPNGFSFQIKGSAFPPGAYDLGLGIQSSVLSSYCTGGTCDYSQLGSYQVTVTVS